MLEQEQRFLLISEFRIPAGTLIILADVVCDLPHSFQINAGSVPYIRTIPLSFASFLIHSILHHVLNSINMEGNIFVE
jgi:hypothetical protein